MANRQRRRKEEQAAVAECDAEEEAAAARAAAEAAAKVSYGVKMKANEDHATVKDGLKGSDEIKTLGRYFKNIFMLPCQS